MPPVPSVSMRSSVPLLGRLSNSPCAAPKPAVPSCARPNTARTGAASVVQHALFAVIGPLFERGFVADSFANRVCKGTHRPIACCKHYRDRFRHVLRADIWHISPVIDQEILKRELRHRIACGPTLAVCDTIIDGSSSQERVPQCFAGDELFTPQLRAPGIPLDNLTSKVLLNGFLNGQDHFVNGLLRAPCLRYVDHFALCLEGRRLSVHPGKNFDAATA